MYLEKGRSNLAQFVLNNMYKESTVENYGIYINEKSSEVVLFNIKNVYIIKQQLFYLYPALDDPRINIGETHFEIDDVEIDKNLLLKALQWGQEKLDPSTIRKQAGVPLYSSMIK